MHEITNVKCKVCGKPREGDSYHGLMVCKHKGEAMNWEDELRKLMVKGWYINIDDARIFISSLLKKQRIAVAKKLVVEGWISKDGSIYDTIINTEPE